MPTVSPWSDGTSSGVAQSMRTGSPVAGVALAPVGRAVVAGAVRLEVEPARVRDRGHRVVDDLLPAVRCALGVDDVVDRPAGVPADREPVGALGHERVRLVVAVQPVDELPQPLAGRGRALEEHEEQQAEHDQQSRQDRAHRPAPVPLDPRHATVPRMGPGESRRLARSGDPEPVAPVELVELLEPAQHLALPALRAPSAPAGTHPCVDPRLSVQEVLIRGSAAGAGAVPGLSGHPQIWSGAFSAGSGMGSFHGVGFLGEGRARDPTTRARRRAPPQRRPRLRGRAHPQHPRPDPVLLGAQPDRDRVQPHDLADARGADAGGDGAGVGGCLEPALADRGHERVSALSSADDCDDCRELRWTSSRRSTRRAAVSRQVSGRIVEAASVERPQARPKSRVGMSDRRWHDGRPPQARNRLTYDAGDSSAVTIELAHDERVVAGRCRSESSVMSLRGSARAAVCASWRLRGRRAQRDCETVVDIQDDRHQWFWSRCT